MNQLPAAASRTGRRYPRLAWCSRLSVVSAVGRHEKLPLRKVERVARDVGKEKTDAVQIEINQQAHLHRRCPVRPGWLRPPRQPAGHQRPCDTRHEELTPLCKEVSVEDLLRQAAWSEELPGDQAMQTPEDVQAMLKLASLGWGARKIAAELGCSRNTVRRYLRQGGWQAYRARAREGCLAPHARWLQDRFFQHRGNCDVVRQDLQREFGLEVSLRTVERAVATCGAR